MELDLTSAEERWTAELTLDFATEWVEMALDLKLLCRTDEVYFPAVLDLGCETDDRCAEDTALDLPSEWVECGVEIDPDLTLLRWPDELWPAVVCLTLDGDDRCTDETTLDLPME